MKGFITTFVGFLLIMCPFTIIIGLYLIDKGITFMYEEIKNIDKK